MDLQLTGNLFIIGGASSGFGRAISEALIKEGAEIIAIARNHDKLKELQDMASDRVQILPADLTHPETIPKIVHILQDRTPHGILLNAGGPPVKSFLETTTEDWNNAYQSLLFWKIQLLKILLPRMMTSRYGRILFLESIAVKQPVENLILSNSLRLAVVGLAKTLSQEVASHGITVNVLAPGYHQTSALERIIRKKSETTGLPLNIIEKQLAQSIPAGRLGKPEEFATLALWLLSPLSAYVTGQTISVDGGMMRGTFG